MVLPRLLPRSARSAVLGFAEPVLWGDAFLQEHYRSDAVPFPVHHIRVWYMMMIWLVTGFRSIKGSCYNYCAPVSKDVTYKELKNLLNSKNIMLIDVRETWEILEYGKIPGSINIPLDEVGQALQMNPGDFKEKYNEVKPSKSDSLVFSCLAGVRSKKALDTAISLGFNSAQHYAGGWKEWATYEFSKKKQGN